MSFEHHIVPVIMRSGKEGLRNLLFYQFITKGVPVILRGSVQIVKGIVSRRVKHHVQRITAYNMKVKTSSILLQRDYEKNDGESTIFDAVLSHVAELPQTKFVKRTATGVFVMSSTDEIEISPSIYIQKVKECEKDEKLTKLSIEVYSYTYDLTTLRKVLDDLEERYKMIISNQLGKNIYYFDEIPFQLPYGPKGKPDLSKALPQLNFVHYPLYTNKSLSNIYGDAVKVVKKRVDFFVNNKRWYEEKGVPYTLGLLLHGVPGAGKTSCIKSIAKDTNRHVINIKLSENTTVSQLNNMFYSPQITVNKQGQNKFYDIPIDKRIIVLEDVDCLTDLVLDRSLAKEDDAGSQGEDTYYHNMHMQSFAQVSNEKVTLSTLLNILDGVLEQPGRILIMTSNHPEKLDKALIRPGRIDVIVKFDFCKPHEIAEIVEAFTGVALNENQSNKLQSGVYTPAEVTQAIFENIENVDAIVHALSKTKKQVVATVPTVETVETVPEVLEVQAIQTSPISEIAIQTVQTAQTAQTVQTVSAIPAVKGVPEIPTTTVVNNTLYSPTERKPIERECIGKILNGMCGQETQLDDFFKLL